MSNKTDQIEEASMMLKDVSGRFYTQDFYDYKILLEKSQSPFSLLNPYLLVGQIINVDTWIIHLSIVRQQFNTIAPIVIQELRLENVPFIIPGNSSLHNEILDGRRGLHLVGKIVSILLTDVSQGNRLIRHLVNITRDCFGPEVPDAVKISNCIYISYGTLPSSVNNLKICRNIPVSGKNILINQLRDRNMKWPFSELLPLKKENHRALIARKYLPLHLLKQDPKGSVWKCIKINWIFNSEQCLVKEGRPYQCFDDSNRDIRDRLRWQFQVQRTLDKCVPVAGVKELFECSGRTYLVMEFLEGQSLNDTITSYYSGSNWQSIHPERQYDLIQLTIQILSIVNNLHRQNFIHRDLNPENFMVSQNGKIFVTDLELCFSKTDQSPWPPYLLGTAGFISPQQENMLSPDFSDDIYSLGGILMKVFTGLSPLKFSHQNNGFLGDQLYHFFPDQPICSMIAACYHSDPTERPTLFHLEKTIKSFQTTLLSGQFSIDQPRKVLNVVQTLREGIKALATPLFINENLNWLSPNPGLAEGFLGPIYFLARFVQTDISDNEVSEMFRYHLKFIIKAVDWESNNLEGNFFPGNIDYIICKGQLVINVFDSHNELSFAKYHLLEVKPEGLGLKNGLSGKGLAILNLPDHFSSPEAQQHLRDIILQVIHQQQPDGSWIIGDENEQVEPLKILGLFNGIAGITYFLISCAEKLEYKDAGQAALKALDYLSNTRTPQNNHQVWPVNATTSEIDPWLEHGFTGIAFTFIYAYRYFKDATYKDIATNALVAHPTFISSYFTNFSNGLAGLGEVYLEAAKIFNEPQWTERAHQIADFFQHTGNRSPNGFWYWHPDDYMEHKIGMCDGHSGILHFLLRCACPEQFSFPFLQ